MKIKTEYDRLLSIYGPPIKPNKPWRIIHQKPSMCIARTANHHREKKQFNAAGFHVLK